MTVDEAGSTLGAGRIGVSALVVVEVLPYGQCHISWEA